MKTKSSLPNSTFGNTTEVICVAICRTNEVIFDGGREGESLGERQSIDILCRTQKQCNAGWNVEGGEIDLS